MQFLCFYISRIVSNWWRLIECFLAGLGFVWTSTVAWITLGGKEKADVLTYCEYVTAGICAGGVLFLADGFWRSGYLRRSVTITSNAFSTRIVLKYGDIFSEEGWKAIAVNDFFDHIVDGMIVSPKSLHGIMLQKFWGGNSGDWHRQVTEQLHALPDSPDRVKRSQGNTARYPIGTTVTAITEQHKFLCVALSRTDAETHRTTADIPALYQATTSLLKKAGIKCGNEVLSIPLLGDGLSKVNLKPNVLLHLLIAAIIAESKCGRITGTVQIVLRDQGKSGVNIHSVQQHWR